MKRLVSTSARRDHEVRQHDEKASRDFFDDYDWIVMHSDAGTSYEGSHDAGWLLQTCLER